MAAGSWADRVRSELEVDLEVEMFRTMAQVAATAVEAVMPGTTQNGALSAVRVTERLMLCCRPVAAAAHLQAVARLDGEAMVAG